MPFHPLPDGNCGPASLASLLNHLGDPVTAQEVSKAILRPDYRGSTTLDMLLYPRGRGFSSRWYEGSTDDLLRRVDAGRPLLVMIDQGIGPVSKNHFLAIIGYRAEGVVAAAADPAGETLEWERFLRQWGRAKRWTLVVEPKTGGTQ